jgi:hypothetical protein
MKRKKRRMRRWAAAKRALKRAIPRKEVLL